MASTALSSWQNEGAQHLDELLLAHRLVGGPARGRRWRTAGLNEALVLRLAAEFQGFARELHDLGCDVLASWIAPSNPAARQVVRNRLREGRELDRGNAHPGAIGKDFGRFGFEVWPALAIRDQLSSRHNQSLARLNAARNALTHADEPRLATLRLDGFPLVLSTFRRWRHDLDTLSRNLDVEVGTQLGRLFGRPEPW
ncbi:MAG: hypothetical protein ACYDB7_12055 [Mycobacteriales bacterium]